MFAGTFDNRFAGWVDFDLLDACGITLIDTSRGMIPSVAEFALAMTLNLIRDIPESMYLLREGGWQTHPFDSWQKPGFVYGDLTGRRLGLAGLGSINRRYAELLAPFRCDVGVYDPYVSDEVFSQYGVKRANSLVELAQSSEIFRSRSAANADNAGGYQPRCCLCLAQGSFVCPGDADGSG